MRGLTSLAVAAVVAAAVAVPLGASPVTASWSSEPFAVSGHLVRLIGPPYCSGPADEDLTCESVAERLQWGPCPSRFEHDAPNWSVAGCDGSETTFADGTLTMDGLEETLQADSNLAPNAWFAPTFDDWTGPTVELDDVTLYLRVLTYDGQDAADVIGLDRDGVPVLYVQRNQSWVEEISVFVRDGGRFPTADEVASALEQSGLPAPDLAEAVVADDRVAAAVARFTGEAEDQ
jgi:hypothetical protein